VYLKFDCPKLTKEVHPDKFTEVREEQPLTFTVDKEVHPDRSTEVKRSKALMLVKEVKEVHPEKFKETIEVESS
jgi:hypothetical protein